MIEYFLLLNCTLKVVKVKLLSVSDSLRPHRLELTRLPHPWDFPGKGTGVACHFFLQVGKMVNLTLCMFYHNFKKCLL